MPAPPASSEGQQRNLDAFLSVVSAQPDSHITFLDHFLKHDEQSEISEKQWAISYSPIFKLILGLEKLCLGSNLTLLIQVRHTEQFPSV